MTAAHLARNRPFGRGRETKAAAGERPHGGGVLRQREPVGGLFRPGRVQRVGHRQDGAGLEIDLALGNASKRTAGIAKSCASQSLGVTLIQSVMPNVPKLGASSPLLNASTKWQGRSPMVWIAWP